jgi:DNA-binding NarL/FixJ family response regulator/class 3 adenylate cyclase
VSSSAPGTVTFLLADVEGSSGMQGDERVDYPVIIGRIRSILREAVREHGGHEIDAVGDELLAAFSDATRAVDAAYQAQRAMRDEDWPELVPVRIRIGLHTGTPSIGVEGYTGIDLVRTSRIANAGHGGQILASATTVSAVDGIATRDLGQQQLERLPQPEHIHQLLADDLPQDFPALRNTSSTVGKSIRVALADDTVLLREGVARLLTESGFEVVSQAGNGEDLLRHVGLHKPDVAIVDIRMPPTHTDEGLRAARTIRERFPDTGVLVLSQYVEAGYAVDLLTETEGVGYLLKDRVADLEQFATAVRRVADGGSALDPAVVSQLVGRRGGGPLDELSPREREVMELIAEGRSNQAIADRLFVTLRAVEKHVTSIFEKLGLPATSDDHRRVLAVLAYLRG